MRSLSANRAPPSRTPGRGGSRTGRELIEQCSQDFAGSGHYRHRRAGIDGLEAAAAIFSSRRFRIIVISGYHGPEVIERTVGSHVMAYLVKPVKQADLNPVITMAMERSRPASTTEDRERQFANDRASRATIERALQILMKWMPQQGNQTLGQLRNGRRKAPGGV